MRRLFGLHKMVRRLNHKALGWLFPTDADGVESPLAVGANGETLVADDTQPGGMRWSPAGGGGGLGTSLGAYLGDD